MPRLVENRGLSRKAVLFEHVSSRLRAV